MTDPSRPGSPYAAPQGMSPWLKAFLGGLIGLAVGAVAIVGVLVVLVNSIDAMSGASVVALMVLVAMLLPAPLLLFRSTRMWAVGLIIGAGIGSIALAGTCVIIIDSLSGNSV